MKARRLNLLSDVSAGVYDQTKLSTLGRAAVRTLEGRSVVAPPFNQFADVGTDTPITTISATYLTVNGRLFVLSNLASGLATLALYTHDASTGAAPVYVGRLLLTIPNLATTTHTLRGFKVLDDNPLAMQAVIQTTGSVTINGGLFVANSLAVSDFQPSGGVQIFFATSANAKAMYFLQDPLFTGAAHNLTNGTGIILDKANQRIYGHYGISAAHFYALFDMTAALGSDVGITGQTVTAPVATPGVFTATNHGFAVGDPVAVYTTGTLTLSGGGGVSVLGGVQNQYFIATANFTANTFSLSATSGGAAVNITVSTGTHTVRRAFGTTRVGFLARGANLPTLLGTLLNTNSEDQAIPSHTPLAGSSCAAFGTSTHLYLGRLSEIIYTATATTANGNNQVTGISVNTANFNVGTVVYGPGIPANTTVAAILSANSVQLNNNATASGTVTLYFGPSVWPSLITSNNNGPLGELVTITPTHLNYSDVIDQFVMFTQGGFFAKQLVNNQLTFRVGAQRLTQLNGAMVMNPPVGGVTFSAMDLKQGYLVAAYSTVGQIGVQLFDMRSQSSFEYSVAITPVIDVTRESLQSLNILTDYARTNNALILEYRTSGFGSATGGWLPAPADKDLSTIATSGQVQFRFCFPAERDITGQYPVFSDAILVTQPEDEISESWVGDAQNTTRDGDSPTRSAFLKRDSVAGPWVFRARTLAGVLVAEAQTNVDTSLFEYSTNGGLTWSSTPTDASGVVLRYNWASPPGVDVVVSLRKA